MDLGFGKTNQTVGAAAARALLRNAEAQERAIDDRLSEFDALLDDDAALERIRRDRIARLKRDRADRERWAAAGHGGYAELGASETHNASADVGRDFFGACRESERLVVHFYRPTTRCCDVFHKHLKALAPAHLETRFVKLNVEGCDREGGAGASFLVERLGVVVMPTLVLIKDRKTVHQLRGFDELGGTEDFSTKALEYVLGAYDVLQTDVDEPPPELTKSRGLNSIRIRK